MNPSSSRMQRPGARHGRPAAAQTHRAGRRADVARRGVPSRRVGIAGGWIQRRHPPTKESGLAKALGGVSGAVPGLGKSRPKPARSSGTRRRSGQVGGVALLTAAAGLALKNREKLTAMLRRDQQGAPQAGPQAGQPGAPATAPATDVAGPTPAPTARTVGGNAGP
jgi:hypothetical protein